MGENRLRAGAEQVMASRYAAGEIDEDEHRRRLAVLRQVQREVD